MDQPLSSSLMANFSNISFSKYRREDFLFEIKKLFIIITIVAECNDTFQHALIYYLFYSFMPKNNFPENKLEFKCYFQGQYLTEGLHNICMDTV
ncbi:hypothetical protein T08_8169 [Trichinella sp. T8]|nr:hypothetical protein T08_8169 [Trichinella sp. T8]